MAPKREKENSNKRGRSSKSDRSNDSLESDDEDYRKKRDRNNQVCD